ncbi:hypothetical protein SMD22_17465 [Brevibacillus halotolerans]|nr:MULTISPECIES: hypothetical protein [Brevibacillus]MCR8962958.1 hypothetical protein [Brevibacillus laterosporus]MCR8997175.1 hypothetical protein [Brevibacillus laterosporus]MCZ0835114.1 hypothetical protein [Brevibacillus halotolerans]WPS86295.1 hypothetical protein SMD22_17465 [Brevibacillus halotolerans]
MRQKEELVDNQKQKYESSDGFMFFGLMLYAAKAFREDGRIDLFEPHVCD